MVEAEAEQSRKSAFQWRSLPPRFCTREAQRVARQVGASSEYDAFLKLSGVLQWAMLAIANAVSRVTHPWRRREEPKPEVAPAPEQPRVPRVWRVYNPRARVQLEVRDAGLHKLYKRGGKPEKE